MSTNIIQQIRERASTQNKAIVFPESGDPRVLQAATFLSDNNICQVELIGNSREIVAIATRSGITLSDNIQFLSFDKAGNRDQLINHLYQRRKHKGMTKDDALQQLQEPLYLAAVLVATNEANGCVAGSIATTGEVIRAAIHGIGLREGNETVSSTFLMALEGRPPMTYADCGVVPYPEANQLRDIAIESARTHRLLTQKEPKIAMLSFSTKGSAKHERTELVLKATKLIQEQAPQLTVDGELQFDAAFVPEIAKRKAPDSPIKGRGNVFIFPNLDAGNIAYKITERLAGASATGPILQGLDKPMMDLSRGCNWQDIVNAACVAILKSE